MATAAFTTIDSIIGAFERMQKKPYWSMWYGKEKAGEFSEDNLENSVDQLNWILTQHYNAGSDKNFHIALHTRKPKSECYEYADTANVTKLLCQLHKPATQSIGSYRPTGGTDSALLELLKEQIAEKNNAIASRLAAIEDRLNEDIIEEETEEEKPTSRHEEILGYVAMAREFLPYVKDIAAEIGLIKKPAPVTQLAGISDKIDRKEAAARIQAAINTLIEKGVKVEHFEKLAEFTPDRLSMLLSML